MNTRIPATLDHAIDVYTAAHGITRTKLITDLLTKTVYGDPEVNAMLALQRGLKESV